MYAVGGNIIISSGNSTEISQDKHAKIKTTKTMTLCSHFKVISPKENIGSITHSEPTQGPESMKKLKSRKFYSTIT